MVGASPRFGAVARHGAYGEPITLAIIGITTAVITATGGIAGSSIKKSAQRKQQEHEAIMADAQARYQAQQQALQAQALQLQTYQTQLAEVASKRRQTTYLALGLLVVGGFLAWSVRR